MTQSASGPYPVRPIDENELDGFISVDEHAFNTSPWSADDRRVALDLFEFDRTLAAFDDTTPVGVTMCYTFQLSVPGLQMLPAAGVTFVAVMPTYRRQGVLSSLMRRQLADVRDRGEPLAILWASEAVIYGRYGYGRASWHLDFTLRRGEGGLADPGASAGDGLRLRIAQPEAALPELAKVYDAVLASRPGMFGRNDAWWRLSTTTTAPGGDLAASCVPTSSPADLALDVTELGAAYLGGTRLGALTGSGLVSELRPGATRQLSAALTWDPAPWCPMVF